MHTKKILPDALENESLACFKIMNDLSNSRIVSEVRLFTVQLKMHKSRIMLAYYCTSSTSTLDCLVHFDKLQCCPSELISYSTFYIRRLQNHHSG